MGDSFKWAYEYEEKRKSALLKYKTTVKGKVKKKLDLLAELKKDDEELDSLKYKLNLAKEDLQNILLKIKDIEKCISKNKKYKTIIEKKYLKYKDIKIPKATWELFEQYIRLY